MLKPLLFILSTALSVSVDAQTVIAEQVTSVQDYMRLTLANGGYAQLVSYTVPGQCSPVVKCQTGLEVVAVPDQGNQYANPNLSFVIYNPVTGVYQTLFAHGAEKTASGENRLYWWDSKYLKTIAFVESAPGTETFTFEQGVNVLVHDSMEVRGSTTTPYLFGGMNPGSVLTLRSTYNAAAAGDRVDVVVGAVGSEVTAVSVDHGGLVTLSKGCVGCYTKTGSAVLDFPNITVNNCSTLALAVPGAVPGDAVAVGAPGNLVGGIVVMGFVSVNDTVNLRACNQTAGALNPAAGMYTARVLR